MRLYGPKKILVPVDLSLISKEVLRAAMEIGKNNNAEVCALHVMSVADHIAFYAGEFSGTVGMEREEEESKFLCESRLAAMLNEVGAGSRVHPLIVKGDPVSEIIRLAETEDIDLIVMATRGRRGLSRLLRGSVTEQIVRYSPCPVLSMRARAHELLPCRAGAPKMAVN